MAGLTRQVSNAIAAACIVPRGGRVGLHSFMVLYHCGQNVVTQPQARCCDTVQVNRQRRHDNFNTFLFLF